MKFYYLLIIASVFLASCIKDKPQEPVRSGTTISAEGKVLIVNEGGFGNKNADISVYDATTGSITDNFYRQQNNNEELGDVCQSVTRYNNQYYLVLNNSNKIIVVNAGDFKKTATIRGFNSPRYIIPVTYSKAYVSDLYASSIQVVDLNTKTITGNIPCMNGTEQMELIYNKAFVTNSNSMYCYVINTISNMITDSIPVGKGASSLVTDKNSKIWILAGGSASGNQAGKLLRIDPVNLQVEISLNFTLADNSHHLCINKTRDTLYYLNKGINRFVISDSQLPSSPLVSQGTKIYYGLGFNPKDYTIYVSDAIDYIQKSKIEIYRPDGTFKASLNAGIISNGFVFD